MKIGERCGVRIDNDAAPGAFGSSNQPRRNNIMRQIDSRYVDRGQGIEAVWDMDDEGHYVTVAQHGPSDVVCVLTTVYIGSDADAAEDAYLHPFASAKVPSPWDRESVAATDSAEYGVKVGV